MATAPHSNTWYKITLKPSLNNVPALQAGAAVAGGAPVFLQDFDSTATGQYWQFFPNPDSTNGRYFLLRSLALGPDWFLTAALEVGDGCGATGCVYQPGMHDFTYNAAALWGMSAWDDGTFRLYTNLTGDGYLLDAMNQTDPDTLVMSTDTTGVDYAQHWEISAYSSRIDNHAYSTAPAAYFSAASSSSTTAPTSSTSSPSMPTLSPTATSKDDGLSSGGKVGIAVAIVVAALIAFLAALLFFRRLQRRKRARYRSNVDARGYSQVHTDMLDGRSGEQGLAKPQMQTQSAVELPVPPFELAGEHVASELPGHDTTSG